MAGKGDKMGVAPSSLRSGREILFVKIWQQFTWQQDGGMKHTDSYGIIDSCRFKENDPVLGLDDLTGQPNLGRREYGCVSPQQPNSMNSSAEAGQPKQNKHPPHTDDPTLEPRRDRELPMRLRMTVPTPKVIRTSSVRRNLLLRCLCNCG